MDSARFCPGSKALREPVPEDYPCPRCGAAVEIWSDEHERTCTSCGALVRKVAAALPQCADWCPAAARCLGEDVLSRRRAALD